MCGSDSGRLRDDSCERQVKRQTGGSGEMTVGYARVVLCVVLNYVCGFGNSLLARYKSRTQDALHEQQFGHILYACLTAW